MRVRLGEANRQILGVDRDDLPLDLGELYQSEAEALNDALGLDPERWLEFLRGQDTGVLDADGKPVRQRPAALLRVLVWLALRRSGHRMDLAAVDFDRRTLEILPDPGEEEQPDAEEPGKGPAELASSDASERPTPSPSFASSQA